ncbi:MAG: DJ-1/PfpI family protein [Caldisericia bacterium]|nr:DJ-1/PfpI family protein [Caldisericia bacterium]
MREKITIHSNEKKSASNDILILQHFPFSMKEEVGTRNMIIKLSRKSPIILLLGLLISFSSFTFPSYASLPTLFKPKLWLLWPPPTIGIYVDEGAWRPGVLALHNFCKAYGYFTKDVFAYQINENKMEDQFDVLIMPGGWAASYNVKIDSQGMANIRNFVKKGGSIVGICAGAYFLADKITWENIVYDYPLNLFDGEVKGSLHAIKAWDGHINTMITLRENHPINQYFPSQLTLPYAGGGDIWPSNGNSQNFTVIATLNSTNNTVGIASITYGSGSALLIAIHPEMGLDKANNWVTDGTETAQWMWLNQALRWLVS